MKPWHEHRLSPETLVSVRRGIEQAGRGELVAMPSFATSAQRIANTTGKLAYLRHMLSKLLWNQRGSLLVVGVGEQQILSILLAGTATENLTLKLYVNNITPSITDVAGTYTEMSTQGYAALTLTRGGTWSVAGTNPAVATYAQQTFNFNGTGGTTQVYGYFVVGATSTTLYWAERFSDGPYPISFNGDQIKITPKLNLT